MMSGKWESSIFLTIEGKKQVVMTFSGHCCSCSNTFLQVVLQNLLMCMVCFYSLYYMVVSLCIGLLRYTMGTNSCHWKDCAPSHYGLLHVQGARDQQLAGSIWLHNTAVMAESQILGWARDWWQLNLYQQRRSTMWCDVVFPPSWCHLHRSDLRSGRAGVCLDCRGVGLGLRHNGHFAAYRDDGSR